MMAEIIIDSALINIYHTTCEAIKNGSDERNGTQQYAIHWAGLVDELKKAVSLCSE